MRASARSGGCHGSQYRGGREPSRETSHPDLEIRKFSSEKFKLELIPEAKVTKGMLKEITFQADHSGKGSFQSERLMDVQGPYCELLDLAGLQNMVRMRWESAGRSQMILGLSFGTWKCIIFQNTLAA